jgi:hypothetical protein
MTSDADKIKKLKALIADPAATDGERAAAREKIAAISHPARGMSDAELAATIARLKDERAAIPIPHDVERRRKEKREEIERHERERNKRYKKKLKAMTDEEVAAAARLSDSKTWWMRELAWKEKDLRRRKMRRRMTESRVFDREKVQKRKK